MKKRKKIFFTVFFTFVILYLVILWQWPNLSNRVRMAFDYRNVSKVRSIIEKEKYIIHAGGFVEGKDGKVYDYTNSMDALINAYEHGRRVIEIDFLKAADREIICGHNDENWCKGIDAKEPLTSEQFKNEKIYSEFNTMTLSDLTSFMKDHVDLYIVTDVKGANDYFCNKVHQEYPELMDRFIIQIYHKEEYDIIHGMGYNNIIYTLYRSSEEELDTSILQKFAKEHSLIGFTFWYYYADDKDFYDGMLKTKVPLYVHTLNDKEDIAHYFDIGISAIYTDNVD